MDEKVKLKKQKKYIQPDVLFDTYSSLFKPVVMWKGKIGKTYVEVRHFQLDSSILKSLYQVKGVISEISGRIKERSSINDDLDKQLSIFRQLSRMSVYRLSAYRPFLKSQVVKHKILFRVKHDEQHKKNFRLYHEIYSILKNLRFEIHDARIHNKELNEKTRHLDDNELLSYRKIGSVMKEAGTILLLQKKKKIVSIFKDKKPKTEKNHIGVELEFCSKLDKDKLAEKIYDANLIEYCAWHEDQSLRPKEDEFNHEVSIIAEENQIYEIISRLCKVLNETGAVSDDRRCGLHIHFDMRQRNKEMVFSNLVACQRWLLKMVPPSRRNGEFCKRVTSRKFPKKFNGSREERYKTINAAAFYRHQTLEIRLHEGTVDAKLINNWIMFLLKIVNHKSELKESVTSISQLFKIFRMNKNIQTYVLDRINYQRVNGGVILGRLRAAIGRHIDTLTTTDDIRLEPVPAIRQNENRELRDFFELDTERRIHPMEDEDND